MDRIPTSIRLRQIMQERGIKQVDLVRMCAPYAREYNISMGKSAISQYVSGKSLPAQRQLSALGQALNVSEAWLMGFDVPRERTTTAAANADAALTVPGLYPVHKKKFPVLGKIACGEPVFAEENRNAFIMSSDDIDADFCLVASGDSMAGAHIEDGDIVFVKETDVVPNGQIAVVLIGDEATLKYIDYRPESATLILTPANPDYRTQVYTGDELDQIRVLGMAVTLQKNLTRRK